MSDEKKPDLAAFLASYQTLRAAEKALDASFKASAPPRFATLAEAAEALAKAHDAVAHPLALGIPTAQAGELADAVDTAREAFVTTAEQFAAVWATNRAEGLRWTPAKCDGCKATMGYALVPASPHWSPAKCPECYHQGAKP